MAERAKETKENHAMNDSFHCDDKSEFDQSGVPREVTVVSVPEPHQHRSQEGQAVVPAYSKQSMALLASQLDSASIDFLIKALK